MLLHHPHRTHTDLGREVVRLLHGSIFLRVEAASKPGAIQLTLKLLEAMDAQAVLEAVRTTVAKEDGIKQEIAADLSEIAWLQKVLQRAGLL